MFDEKMLGADASYLSRLGALSALVCGAVALLGIVLVALQPAAENVVAVLACAGLAVAGVATARGN